MANCGQFSSICAMGGRGMRRRASASIGGNVCPLASNDIASSAASS